MNLLQYTSSEMFSSTELIRKSKMIFDKLNTKEIEKAVILRDGKPSFMLMDFYKYESLIQDYLELQEKVKTLEAKKTTVKKEKIITPLSINEPEKKDEIKEEIKTNPTDIKSTDEINSNDLEEALAKIDELDINLGDNSIAKNETPDQQLKDFWE